MININVEDYCQNCPDFEPEVNKTILEADNIIISTDTCITCKYSDRCKQIYRYIMLNESKKEIKHD